jgi:hypothetical protein
MSEENITHSVTEDRKEFGIETTVRQAESRHKAAVFSRKLLIRMAAGEPYDVDDFIYVASVGRPQDLNKEAQTIKTIETIKAGDLFGVVDHDKLLIGAGVAATNALVLRVKADLSEDPEDRLDTRQLSAGIRILDYTFQGRPDLIDDRNLGIVEVMHSGIGEPELAVERPFSQVNTVRVGAADVIKASRHSNYGRTIAYTILDELADIVYHETII